MSYYITRLILLSAVNEGIIVITGVGAVDKADIVFST